jgi:large subunit ribosomal protein L25
MSDFAVLPAEQRDRAGKGAARATRREGLVPGVIYGAKLEPVLFKMDPRVLVKAFGEASFMSTQFMVSIDGDDHRVLPRDVQFHPVNDKPMHVDFLRVTDSTRVRVFVPVDFINEEESEGLVRGGVLNVVRHEIELLCTVAAIPDSLVVSLAGMDIGDSAKISDVDLPGGVKPTITDRDFTLATIAAPTVITAEEEAEGMEDEEGLEGEEGEGEEGEDAAEDGDDDAGGDED